MMQPNLFNIETTDPSWQPCLKQALSLVDSDYLNNLSCSTEWLPGPDKLFNAFTLPVDRVNYVLLGESPYPRAHSANGYAFWDAAVKELWSPTGLSKPVNRATSLRNIIKMLLIAEGLLDPEHTSQTDIAELNKQNLIRTNEEFFNRFLNKGFLLLNASLVLQPTPVRKDAAAWRPFIQHVFDFLLEKRPSLELILLGQIANEADKLTAGHTVKKLIAEHPYNISFIQNPDVIAFFKPLRLLMRD